MIKSSFWIHISTLFALIFAKINIAELSDTEAKYMQYKWDECCKTHKCIHTSCYIVQWPESTWSTVRQRCQSIYPDWPYHVDVLRIQDETDIGEFWRLLQKPDVPLKEKPNTIWTGGARCQRTNPSGTTAVTKWISTRESFPAWLDKKINEADQSAPEISDGCEFLVISLSPNYTDVKYDFQDQNAHHSAICEFTFPDVQLTTKLTTQHVSTELMSTELVENEKTSLSTSTQSTLKATATTSILIPASADEKTDFVSSTTTNPQTKTTSPSTTVSPKECKGVNENGITWPNTLAGKTARQKCPEGMIGYAEWHCNGTTLQFQPEKPQTENCKHEWIDHLEDAIRERHDAVEISTKLAKETKHNNMSHGDIIALVNLTSSLLQLYTEQKGEEEFEISENEEVPVYYNFTKTMIASISNILRTEIKDAWEGLNETRQTREASTILKLVTNIGTRLSCIKTSDEKLQFSVSEENIDLQTFILNNTDSREDVIVFPQQTEKVKSNSSIMLPANLKLNREISLCRSYASGVGVIYKHVGDFLKAGQLNSSTQIATKVLSFSLTNTTESISLAGQKVNITLQHLIRQDVRFQINPRCVFWNFSKSAFGEWDDSGCHLLSFNETHTQCQCDHVTNFAVLMDVNDNVSDDDILTMMTYVCCGLSSLTLVLTLVCFLAIRSLHGRRSIITGNLCFSLLVTNMLIIFGLDKTQNGILCAIVAGVLHYWILSAFCWMLVEGYHLYRMVILVFQRGSNLPVKFYYIFAYGTPLLVVGISAAVRNEGYGGKKYCWLSPNEGLIWSFVGPACAIILVNIVIFILTLRSASSVKIKREQSTIKKIKSWIRGSISVMCLLGLTWCIGLLYIDRKLHFFSYIFTILNGLQGVFIFLFHILLNDKVNSLFSCSSKDIKKFGRRKCLNHTSSNQTNSKTSTRTSMNSVGCTSSTKFPDSRKQSAMSLRNCATSNAEYDTRKQSTMPLKNCIISNGESVSSDMMNRGYSNKKKTRLYPSLSNELREQASPL